MENTKVEIKDTELAAVTGGGTDPMDISDRIVRGDYGNGEAEKYQLRSSIGIGSGGGGGAGGAGGGSDVVIKPEPNPDLGPTSPTTNIF